MGNTLIKQQPRLKNAVSNQNNLLISVFDVLSDTGKKKMIDAMTFSISCKDYEPYLFVQTLIGTGRVNEETKSVIHRNIKSVYEYINQGTNRPDALVELDKMNELLENKFTTVKEIYDDRRKQTLLHNLTEEFICTGSYECYLFIRKLSWFMGIPIENVIKKVVDLRTRYLYNKEKSVAV